MTRVAPTIVSAIGIGQHWVSLTVSGIISFVLIPIYFQLHHSEHMTFASKVLYGVVMLLQCFAVG